MVFIDEDNVVSSKKELASGTRTAARVTGKGEDHSNTGLIKHIKKNYDTDNPEVKKFLEKLKKEK